MENKVYVLKVDTDNMNTLQRLQIEVDSRKDLIDRMISNHKDDSDASVFESIPFKKYNSEYESAFAEYQMAKDAFSAELFQIVSEKEQNPNVKFDWMVVSFLEREVQITIR